MREEEVLALRLSPHGSEFETPEQKKALLDALTRLPTCTDPAEVERLYWQIDNFIMVQGRRGPDAHLLFQPLLDAMAGAAGIGRNKLLEAAHQLFFSGRQLRYSTDGEQEEREHLQRVLSEYRALLEKLRHGGAEEERWMAAELLDTLT